MKFIDLFAGIGGFRLGMESAGHKCVAFCEIDKFARASYKAIHNTKGEIEYHDITSVTNGQWSQFRGTVDVICGGFPCQAFSVAGKRKGFLDETRGTLFFEIARAAKQIKPRILFLENVKGLLSHDKGRTFGIILNTLDELGYDCEWQVLNSKNFGVPQNRERVFIVGHLRGERGREVFPITGKNATAINVINKKDGMPRETNRVYSSQGLSPTLNTMQGGGREPKIIIGQPTRIDGKRQVNSKLSDTVGTLLASQYKNGDTQPKVVIPVLTPDRAEKRQNGRRFKENGEPMFTLTAQDRHGVAVLRPVRTKYGKEIRKAYENGEVEESRHNMTKLEPRQDGISNTITTVQKDNLVLFNDKRKLEENQETKIMNPFKGISTFGWHFEQNVFDVEGLARTSKAGGGSGNIPKIVQKPRGFNKGGEHEVAPTLSSNSWHENNLLKSGIRIRKLTPLECWRLQGFPDWAFDKAQEVNSNSQLYKQAGNSVTVNVIAEIAKKFEDV